MPINPSALGDSQPDRSAPPAEESQHQLDEQQADPKPEESKRKRRTKAELIADAVVPGNQDQVDLKDKDSGAKIQRPWLVAVEMIRDGKAEFADKAMKYAMLKYDEQKAATEREAKSSHIPDGAQPGDEVEINGEKYRVGHGGVLTTSPVAPAPDNSPTAEERGPFPVPEDAPTATTPATNGSGAGDVVQPQTLPAGVEVEQISDGVWKVGTGILEKIGLPDYSSLQIGPISASRTVLDDGNRVEVQIGERTAMIPANVVVVAQEAMDIVEYIARYQRGELVSFLESTGALKQPVS